MTAQRKGGASVAPMSRGVRTALETPRRPPFLPGSGRAGPSRLDFPASIPRRLGRQRRRPIIRHRVHVVPRCRRQRPVSPGPPCLLPLGVSGWAVAWPLEKVLLIPASYVGKVPGTWHPASQDANGVMLCLVTAELAVGAGQAQRVPTSAQRRRALTSPAPRVDTPGGPPRPQSSFAGKPASPASVPAIGGHAGAGSGRVRSSLRGLRV